MPGGVMLLIAAAAFEAPIPAQTTDFYYYAVFSVGILLAWRFHSSRVTFILLSLLLAHHAIEFFSGGHIHSSGPGHIAFESVALLIPINVIIFSLAAERGFAVPALASRFCLLFFEAVFVAVICRPEETLSPVFMRLTPFGVHMFGWTKIPQPALLAFIVAAALVIVRFRRHGKPVEHGLIWSLAATVTGLHFGGVGHLGSAYFATAALILVASLIENSYFLAYHDELTALPSRRAFNDASLGLEPPYVIASADIDRFKKVNDTYGHDTGDQVLSMVAGHLSRVSAGAQAYRVGGEEFSILFPGKTVEEVLPQLEKLRASVAESSFRPRITAERRKNMRGPDRRHTGVKSLPRAKRATGAASLAGQLTVTISIGVAEPDARTQGIEATIAAADKALYRAKRGGRNRVEVATSSRRSLARRAASS